MSDTTVRLKLSDSYAYLAGGDVRVVLVAEDPITPDEVAELRFRSEGRTVRAAVQVSPVEGGTQLLATVPRTRLGRGMWRPVLRSPSGDAKRVEGRLLLHPRKPVTLLPGPAPKSGLVPSSTGRKTPARPAMKRAARALDKPLRLLPDHWAGLARRAARGAARRISG